MHANVICQAKMIKKEKGYPENIMEDAFQDKIPFFFLLFLFLLLKK